MIEALPSGIVLGLIPITLAGLFVTAYSQYRRGDQLDIWSWNILQFHWPPTFPRRSDSIARSSWNELSIILRVGFDRNRITLCRIWTYGIRFWRPTFYRTELRALSFIFVDKGKYLLFILLESNTFASDMIQLFDVLVESISNDLSFLSFHRKEGKGRDDRIWTCDILYPKQTRYQAALHPF